MTTADGKKRLTDITDTKQLLRIIQAIPSSKAEPFNLWLDQVSRVPIEEPIDLELTIERSLETYLKKGYPRERINQRLQVIQVRKELTVEWDARGVQKDIEYAILTDEITHAWSGMSTRQYRSPSFFRISLTISIHAPRGGSDAADCRRLGIRRPALRRRCRPCLSSRGRWSLPAPFPQSSQPAHGSGLICRPLRRCSFRSGAGFAMQKNGRFVASFPQSPGFFCSL